MNRMRIIGGVLLVVTGVLFVVLRFHYASAPRLVSQSHFQTGKVTATSEVYEMDALPLPIPWRVLLLVGLVSSMLLVALSWRTRRT
jgi:hypothetical protein